MGIKKAKTKELKKLSAAELGQSAAPAAALEKITLPQKQKSTQIISGNAKEAAATLVEKLKFEVRVI
jgi:electron transfer flavoprotein beta subunit